MLRLPEQTTVPGDGAAQLNHPRGVAGNPLTGHVYVAERQANRVSEYTAWGLFVRAWGWDVAPEGAPGDTPSDEFEKCGPAVPEGAPPATLCQAGVAGEEQGQFRLPGGLAVDSGGDVYVFDTENQRVQKFTADGDFVLMFGGGVNKTKVEAGAPASEQNVCDATDVCQAGASGEAPSQFAGNLGDFIAYSLDADAILVGDKDRIQIFEPDGTYREEVAFEGPLSSFAGESVNGLEVGPGGDVYMTLSGASDVYRLSAAGVPLAPGKPGESKFEVANPLGVAVDADGRVYSAEVQALAEVGAYVLGFEADGDLIAGMGPGDEFAKLGDDLTALAVNECAGSDGPLVYVGRNSQGFGDHYSFVDGYGAAPIGCAPPPPRPPEILDQFASVVHRENAVVQARINPKFWIDTTFYVEYGIGKCSEGGCVAKTAVSPLTPPGKSVNKVLTTAGVVLDGLESGVTYNFRFVAQSSGGGPTFGGEGSFRTFGPVGTFPPCPNDDVKKGPSANLPDCRAYEMVSPLDKGNADVALWITRNAVRERLLEIDQSASSGDRFTFTAANGFGDPESAPFVSQYLANRTATGWLTDPISPPHTESPLPADDTFANDFRGFTDDLCGGWVRHFSVAPLVVGGVEEYSNLYRRENCSEPPVYAPITTEPPPHRSPDEYVELDVKGFSADGGHTIFTADDALHPNAPTPDAGELLLYEQGPDGLRFVCYLPSSLPSQQACSAGTLMGEGASDISSVHNAVSADGSRIFWTASSGIKRSRGSHPGRIFVRVDGEVTRRVSTVKANDPAFFWTAADDGSRAVFSFDSGPFQDHLYWLDVDTETPTLVAKGVEGPLGASEDASRIYFASKEDLDGGGPAVVGDHNLYLFEADPGGGGADLTFIMELADHDIGFDQPSVNNLPLRPIAFSPAVRAARVSADGLHAVFISSAASPTGYDNRDRITGEPTTQVYLYDAVEDALRCLSCAASGTRPLGRLLQPFTIAARIQGWEALHHSPRLLSEDGTRAFFESEEALVPRDTNGVQDVYQWEEEGRGTCSRERDTFSERTGGCVDLISAGQSSGPSTFLDADPNGNNAFFATLSSLVGADYGLNDVYVARVGGGFAERQRRGECEGATCQSPPPPPPVVTPASQVFQGPPSHRAKAKRAKRCPKGKRRVRRKGKVRCVRTRSRHGKGGRGR